MPRVEIAVVRNDGQTQIATAKPRHIVKFCDEFGHDSPENYREMSWLARHCLGEEDVPLNEWIERLEDIDASPKAVGEARAKLTGSRSADPPPTPAPAPATHGGGA